MRYAVAEAIGTFALVFIGAGSVLANAGNVGVALAHGFVLMAMIYALGHISGAHINPAVSIAFLVTKRLPAKLALGYIVSQLVGAAAAGFALRLIFLDNPGLYLGVTQLASSVSPLNGILIETILTFFLVLTIFGVAVDKRGNNSMAGIAIGSVLIFDILVGGALTGAAMNPARAFGPAIASGYWANHLVYWIGPIIGAIIAALIYDKILKDKKSKGKVVLKPHKI